MCSPLVWRLLSNGTFIGFCVQELCISGQNSKAHWCPVCKLSEFNVQLFTCPAGSPLATSAVSHPTYKITWYTVRFPSTNEKDETCCRLNGDWPAQMSITPPRASQGREESHGSFRVTELKGFVKEECGNREVGWGLDIWRKTQNWWGKQLEREHEMGPNKMKTKKTKSKNKPWCWSPWITLCPHQAQASVRTTFSRFCLHFTNFSFKLPVMYCFLSDLCLKFLKPSLYV